MAAEEAEHVGGLPNVCTLLYLILCSCWNTGRHGRSVEWFRLIRQMSRQDLATYSCQIK